MSPGNTQQKLMLIILDGFGVSPATKNNAISHAKTPHWDKWMQNTPHTTLIAAGADVGLPQGQMGNSEVGHMHIGAGRVVLQNLSRINEDINQGPFFKNNVLNHALSKGKTVHIIGLISAGGIHSHEQHIHALIDMAKNNKTPSLRVHAILDGRDTPPKYAMKSLSHLQEKLDCLSDGHIVSIIGRYYAMDRDKRWTRTKLAYDLIANGVASYTAENAIIALENAYERGENDEFVKPTLLNLSPTNSIEDDDIVICMNFRSDRMRQLSHAFIDDTFDHFYRKKKIKLNDFITLTDYGKALTTTVAYPAQALSNTLGEIISKHNLRQLRITETEKYAHVTFFLNGGIEKPFLNESRILIPSPDVATYDLKPEMSAYEISDKIKEAILNDTTDVIICNFANPDMVGHTGNFEATKKAISHVDTCLGNIVDIASENGWDVLITADHGNAEKMFNDETNQVHTAHTSNVVPLVYIGQNKKLNLTSGTLVDVAPTALSLLGLPIPAEMTGNVLLS